jgi:hypothetical protein
MILSIVVVLRCGERPSHAYAIRSLRLEQCPRRCEAYRSEDGRPPHELPIGKLVQSPEHGEDASLP